MESKYIKNENFIFKIFKVIIKQLYDEVDQNFLIENLICELDEQRCQILQLNKDYNYLIKGFKSINKSCLNICEKYEYTNDIWMEK